MMNKIPLWSGAAADSWRPCGRRCLCPITSRLEEDYMVERYDTRGSSRSRLDDPAADMPFAVHAADARPILARLAMSPRLCTTRRRCGRSWRTSRR
jgi:hypothetical protein